MRFLWRLFRKPFTKFYISEANTPVELKELEYAFTDSDGRKYYRFPANLSMPVSRFNELQKFMIWMARKLDGNELDVMVDALEKTLEQGLMNVDKKTGRINAAKIGAIIHEIRSRDQRALNTELIYNILAVQYVREDERPNVYSPSIQLQKVEQFKIDAANEHRFFFLMPELKKLFNLLTITDDEWIELCRTYEFQRHVTEEAMAALHK